MRKTSGFTLIEALVVLSIVAVLMGLAAPSFKSMIQSNNMTNAVNGFLVDMRFARSEAVRRGGNVVMCRSNTPEASNATCDGATSAASGWSTGWIIFHDLDRNGARANTEPLLRVQSGLTSIDSAVETGTIYKFQFDGSGRLPQSAPIVTITFGGGDFATSAKRILCVNLGGRGRIAGDGSTNCN